VLAEGDANARTSMRRLLHNSGHGLFEVVAETGDSGGARRFAHAHQPCVLVLDLDLPGDQLNEIRTIRSESPDAQIVVLAMQPEPAIVCDALRAGATGYVLKGRGREALAHAVRCAAAGYGYVIQAPGPAPGRARGERRPGWPSMSSRADASRAWSSAGP
jgi:DNA-binding NarL/FixJ family response regulator